VQRVIAAPAALSVQDLAVDGTDVMRVLGIAPGPRVGEALERLLEEVLEEPARNTRERLSARLAEMRQQAAGP
jgi:hypothetical protein